MKKINVGSNVILFFVLTFLLLLPNVSTAQVGYNPELLGNASAAPRPGFSPKIFFDYFNQNSVSGNDVEIAIEPQYWMRGFTGDKQKDYIQLAAHIPFGYRSVASSELTDTLGHTTNTGFGLGMINVNVEHFYSMTENKDSEWWFDNGISIGLPTAVGKTGLRIGGNSCVITWFQENFVRAGKWIFSVSPVAVSYAFKDSNNKTTPGLSLNILNSAVGYQILDSLALGATTAYQLGNIAGTNDGSGGTLSRTQRMYVGPAANISFEHDSSLQISVMVDVLAKNVVRGQGVAFAFWHMF